MSKIVFTEEYRNVQDKTDWGSGPWQEEPDKVVWKDPATGFDAMIVRGPSGALCGYVGVKPDHQWHGKNYSEHLPIDGCDGCGYEHTIENLVDVHGGVTFTGPCREEGPRESSICHLADDGQPVWWIGFDCAHAWDRSPAFDHLDVFGDGKYRDLGYVVHQVTNLASQLSGVVG